jgi:hypothetical protein
MRCPYCRETIDDEASVCRSCQREVLVLLEALKKNDELQVQLLALNEKIATLEASRPGTPPQPAERSSTWIVLALVSMMSAAFSVAAYWELRRSLREGERLVIWQLMLAVLMPPLVCGWIARQAGMREPGLKTEGLSLFVALLTVGALDFVGSFSRQEWPYLALIGLGVGFVFQIPTILGRSKTAVVLPPRAANAFLDALVKNAPDLLKVVLPVVLSSLGFKGLSG